MRGFSRACLAAVLTSSLVAGPAWAQNTRPLGLVVLAQAALLDKAEARAGATVYPGDWLETYPGGNLRLRISGAQMYMLADSAAKLADATEGVKAELLRGTAGFSSFQPVPLELETPYALIRAARGKLAHAQVTMLTPTELIVNNYRGALEVEAGGVANALAEGYSYRITIDPDSAQQPLGEGARNGSSIQARRKPLIRIIVIGVIAAGVGYYLGQWIYHEATESPSKFDN